MLLFATDLTGLVIPAILIVFIVGAIIYAYIRKNNYQKNADTMYNGLEVGDKVKTYAGIYGEIASIRDAKDGSKVCVIKTGYEDHYSYFEMDIAAVYGLDEKDVEEVETPEQSEIETKEENSVKNQENVSNEAKTEDNENNQKNEDNNPKEN